MTFSSNIFLPFDRLKNTFGVELDAILLFLQEGCNVLLEGILLAESLSWDWDFLKLIEADLGAFLKMKKGVRQCIVFCRVKGRN